MPFTTKDWRDAPGDLSTPLSAAMVEDLETRVTDYADLVNGQNVQAHGALGDGSTDDTAAINAAIDAATVSGGDVFFPPCSGGYGVTIDADAGDHQVKRAADRLRLCEPDQADRDLPEEHRRDAADASDVQGRQRHSARPLHRRAVELSVTIATGQLSAALTGVGTSVAVDNVSGSFPATGQITIDGVPLTYTAVTQGGGTATFTTATVPTAADNTPIYESIQTFDCQGIRFEDLGAGSWHENLSIIDCDIINFPGAAISLNTLAGFRIARNRVYNAMRGGIVFFKDCYGGVIANNRSTAADDCIAIQANSQGSSSSIGTGPRDIAITGNSCESLGTFTGQSTNNGINLQGIADAVVSGNYIRGAGETGGANKAGIRLGLSDGSGAGLYQCLRVKIVGNNIVSPKGHGVYVPDMTAAEDIAIDSNLITDPYNQGILVSATVNRLSVSHNQIQGANIAAATKDAIQVDDANRFAIDGNRIYDVNARCRYHISLGAGCSIGSVSDNHVPNSDCSSRPINSAAGTDIEMRNNRINALLSLGSATGALTLRDGVDAYNITGTLTITSITASWPGRVVYLKFAGAATISDGNNLKLGTTLAPASADDVISLMCDGTNWYQIAPASVN